MRKEDEIRVLFYIRDRMFKEGYSEIDYADFLEEYKNKKDKL